VHRIAIAFGGDKAMVLPLINAIRELGFTKLAKILATRVTRIVIERVAGELVVKTPFSEASVALMRAVPGRRWDAQAKANRFPATSQRNLFAALLIAFPGEVASGPKGLFVLAA
jgi:hypothetical protein